MPLKNGHKTFIESVIWFYFDDLPTDKELLSAAITRIVEAIKEQSDNEDEQADSDYAHFRLFFQQPWEIKRLESCDEIYIPSIGDVREYMIEYVNGKIVAAAGEESPKNLGWDFERILEATKVREGNGYKLDGNLSHIAKGLSIGLSLEQVQEENFDYFTIFGIRVLTERNEGLTVSDAYEQVLGLDRCQVAGLCIGLSFEQVREDNFGDHTIGAIMTLGILRRGRYMELTLSESLNAVLEDYNAVAGLTYAQVHGLNRSQLDGLSLGLSYEQVREENFGHHTVRGINVLRESDVGHSVSAAYEQVRGLNRSQVEGLNIGLGLEQVNIANFGAHTIFGINVFLSDPDEGLNVSEAYELVRGLNELQVADITGKGFSRWQVQAKYFCQQVWHYVLFLVGVPAAIGAASRHYMHNSFTAVFDTLRFLRQRLPGTNNKARKDVYQKPPSAELPLGDESCSANSEGLGCRKEGLQVSTN